MTLPGWVGVREPRGRLERLSQKTLQSVRPRRAPHLPPGAARHATGAREGEEVMEVREVWRQAHLEQPLGSRDGSRTRQRGGSGLKSTTGGSRGGSSGMALGGSYIKG